MNEIIFLIENYPPDLFLDKKVDIICKILIEDYNSKFVNYQKSNTKNILYIDYSIEDKIDWVLQLKMENFLNCVIKYLDKETFEKIIKNN